MQRRDEEALELLLDRVPPRQLVEEPREVFADLVVGREQPEVFVDAARLRVVVARADVAVVAEHAALFADHEGELAVGLEPDEPVHDVHAGLLELARPRDVRLLVEAGLDLDEGEHLLARLGGVDERLDDGAVAGRAVEGLLDGEHVRVGGGLLEEGLHARRERLVRVVEQHVLARHGLEDVGLAVGLARLELGVRRGHLRRVVQFGAIELREVEEAAEVERRGQPEDLALGDVELAHEEAERHIVHVVGDLETDGRAEPAAQQLLLERFDEVLGLVLLDLDVFVARHAEHVVGHDLHAREEVAEVVRDEVFEGQVPRVLDGLGRVDAHEPRQHLRHLDARELLTARAAVAHAHREVEREPEM